jgi:hypothetical protein
MPVSIDNTQVVFNDSTTQTTAYAGAAPITRYYTTIGTGTWPKPAGLRAIRVTVVGPGGTGATGSGAPGPTGGGGGGGGTAINVFPAPAIPGPQPFRVGSTGTPSYWGPLAIPYAGTNTVEGGTGSNGIGISAGGGGFGAGAGINIGGQAGQGGLNAATSQGGRGGDSSMGGGGQSSGGQGRSHGGGGAGSQGAGGAGSPGLVIVEEFY